LSQKFEYLHVDVLFPGDALVIPPGYIHAVVTLDKAAMTSIDIVNPGMIGAAREAMHQEEELVEAGELRGKRLDDIVRFRDEGVALWRSLSTKVEGVVKEQVDKFIREQEEAVERLAAYLTSQDQKNRTKRKSTEKRNERFTGR
jgi:ribosomal protein L16 Arg81 hydroxylase